MLHARGCSGSSLSRGLRGIRLQNVLGEPDEPLDHLLLLPHDVKHDVQLVDYVTDLALELGLWGHIEKGEQYPGVDFVFGLGLVDAWVDLVFDSTLVDCCEAL